MVHSIIFYILYLKSEAIDLYKYKLLSKAIKVDLAESIMMKMSLPEILLLS